MPNVADLIGGIDPAKPVLLAGPTASGKSELALAIAQAQGRAIVNADALQVYDCWRVLSARPDASDLARAPHFLYGHQGFAADYSVGAWLREVAQHLIRDPRPIIIGGTGLYFAALTEGLTDIPSVPSDLRDRADALRAHSFAGMAADLTARDPQTAAHIDMVNPMRVQRAWEVLEATGKGLRAWQLQTPPPLLALDATTPLVMRGPADVLEDRLTQRFDLMLDQGALDEVRAVLPIWDASRPAARAIGAPELVSYLKGECSLDESRDRAVIATRQFAKRQRTWFRSRMKDWQTVQFPMGTSHI